MKTKALRIALLGVVACVVLAGCSSSSDGAGDGAGDGTAAPIETAPTTPDDDSGPSSSAPSEDGPSPDEGSGENVDETDRTGTDDKGSDDEGSGDEGSETGMNPGAEMPVSPEPTTTSLSELLADENRRPLVSTPLPRAASARGRLVSRFPAFLRPPRRSSTVASSSLSPSGDRLQVSLVASTSLSTDAVLRAYRVRLTARGLTEAAAPATVGGSQATAFRRGPSTVTITVSKEGSRTSYSLHAVLHAGRE